MKQYQSDLTDNQWQFIEKMVEDQRKRKYGLRGIVDAIPYISKTGCQWRMLPKDFAPWQSVHYYFGKWKLNGPIEEIHDFLVARLRLKKGKKILPSVGMIDSQSVKSSNLCQGEVGYDGGKKVKGRKRHIVVDTLGPILTVVVHSAAPHDSKAARNVLGALKDKYLDNIKKIFADGGYRGQLLDWARERLGYVVEIVKRNEPGKFSVLPKRWIVERTFAWISFQRRTGKDYERLTGSSIAFIQIAMIRLMLNKI